jgi:hypothetical protein
LNILLKTKSELLKFGQHQRTLALIHQDLDAAGGFAPRPQTTRQVNNREITAGIGFVPRVRQAVHNIANVLTLGSNPTKVN